MNKAIFLDRDGTINFLPLWKHYIDDIEEVKLLDGVKDWLEKFKKDGYLLVVITNQTWVGAWYYTKELAEKVNRKIEELLWFKFDGIYSCYDKPGKNNKCRKPKTFMVEKACRELNIDIKQSYFIWDKKKDILTWKNAWCKWTCLLTWNYEFDKNIKPDFVARNILEFYNQKNYTKK